MTSLLLLLFAIVAGSFLPLQAAVNAKLAEFVGGPVRASAISFTVGAICLAIVVLLFYRSGGHRAGSAPWWAWIGGALGAVFVTSSVVLPVRIGAAAFFGIVVAAQLVTSVLIDQYGLLSFTQRQISPLRLVGVGLLIAGALLVRLF
ncbi:MAG: bacterial/archaeal transporter family-2 protein [Gaiellaceae bacterium]|nr:bacterial/archaeal transporter family-2 protein [Gaiellaceae bacterium]